MPGLPLALYAARAGRRMAARAFDTLLPPCCVLCGAAVETGSAPVCAPCWQRLPRILPPRCRRCGATSLTPAEGEGCSACAGWRSDSPRTDAVCRMTGEAARLVRELKYSGWTALAPLLGAALADPARRLLERAGPPAGRIVLVPVPISPARRRERGFNQAERLAVGLGHVLRAPVVEALERRRSGSSQARLARRERLANVKRQYRPLPGGRRGDGAPVLLVDDVITSGATATACARALARAGWQPIGLVGFARAWRSLEAGGSSGSM